MAVKQLSAFVENKPGSLIDIVKALSDEKINLRAMSIADTKDFGILRLIVSDVEKAKVVLEDIVLVAITDVIAVEMKDEVGSLKNILNILGNADINVEYMYAFTASKAFGAYVVIRVDDTPLAEKVLTESGINTLTDSDILAI